MTRLLVVFLAVTFCLVACGDDTKSNAGNVVDGGVVQCTPSNVGIELVTAGTAPFLMDTTSGDLIIDTDKQKIFRTFDGGELKTFDAVSRQVVQQPGWPELLVFSATRLLIGNILVNVVGSRGLVLLASQEATIDGTLTVNGTLKDNGTAGYMEPVPAWKGGPGGFDGGRPLRNNMEMLPMGKHVGDGGGPGGGKLAYKGGGARGAGHATAGGESADTSPNAGAGSGLSGNPTLVPLVGGSGGGATSSNTSAPSSSTSDVCGGGGGGAVQITSFGAINVSATGSVLVNGRGGCSGGQRGGGGGGAGGAVLLEGCGGVTIAGKVIANGGGGGAGGAGANQSGDTTKSNDGGASAMPAPGTELVTTDPMNGNMVIARTPSGGNGGAGTTVPGRNQSMSGGGGGSYGRIRLRSISKSPSITGTVSPATTSEGFSIATQ